MLLSKTTTTIILSSVRIVLLMHDTDSAITIKFKSYKSRKVSRSVLSAKIIAFADLFDHAFTVRSQLEQYLGRAVLRHFFTDFKSLFDITSKGSHTRRKRKILGINSARQAYQAHEIPNNGFVCSSENLGHGILIENMQKALLQLLKTVEHKIRCE